MAKSEEISHVSSLSSKVGDSRQWIVSGGDKDVPFVGSDGESDFFD